VTIPRLEKRPDTAFLLGVMLPLAWSARLVHRSGLWPAHEITPDV